MGYEHSEDRSFTYVGSSMYPTLRPLDRIYIARAERYERGDVVVFFDGGGDRFIVHRVVESLEHGVITRGDNSARPDPEIDHSRIIGKVYRLCRDGRYRPVHGGFLGRMARRSIMARKAAIRPVIGICSIVYRALLRATGGRPLWKAETRVMAISGRRMLLVLRGRVIGEYRDSWHIKPPFGLLVDASTLPVPDGRPGREEAH